MRAAIVLAAGRSRRFGQANKLLARYRGKRLVEHAVAAALAAPAGRVIIVAGGDVRVARAVRALGGPRLSVVTSLARHRHANLKRGLQALRAHENEVFVFLGDMPDCPQGIGRRLAGKKGNFVRAVHRCVPGHPILIRNPRAVRARLERGKRPFESGQAVRIEAGKGAIRDIDRPGDLR
ncbi:NTP transferase domain-containing protein [Parasphingopyxis marina]|uniref:NTP transferase domain-containing protein n=1 Tax=Parasphingopyxis marina TaxID=2761622 RepID=A0A842HV96_9SPHN|nr:NTP transferase domain-containing protein [Parasphingopyxis marina]MBC2777938.1 NTP transferase domain-containing protein [Parasphingopyxis marina]